MPEGHKPVLSLGAKLPEVAVAASNVPAITVSLDHGEEHRRSILIVVAVAERHRR